MHTDIIINADSAESRIAVLEDGRLVELLLERADQSRMAGDIYLGTVQAVVPGMQAAFIDIGTDRAGFLHVTDCRQAYDHTADTNEMHGVGRIHPIEQALRENRDLIVQVVREPIGTKGARLTTFLSLPGKYCVLVPHDGAIGVSRRITDPDERLRLRNIAGPLVPDGFGLIVRTLAEGINTRDLQQDIRHLFSLWNEIEKRHIDRQGPFRIHKEQSLELSVVRDLFGPHVDRLITDSRPLFMDIVRQMNGYSRSLRDRVEYYDNPIPLFEYFDVESDIDDLFKHTVRLPNGGSISIEQTEALVAIDVNTAGYSGGHDLEETVFRNNMESVDEIARQLRLRDLGGIIVIDFVDMLAPEHRDSVFERMATAVRRDRARTHLLPISEFGLMEMTRERIRPSLLATLLHECPRCGGAGSVVAPLSAAIDLERRLTGIGFRGGSPSSLEITEELLGFLESEWSERWREMRSSLKDIRVTNDHSDLPSSGFMIHEGTSLF